VDGIKKSHGGSENIPLTNKPIDEKISSLAKAKILTQEPVTPQKQITATHIPSAPPPPQPKKLESQPKPKEKISKPETNKSEDLFSTVQATLKKRRGVIEAADDTDSEDEVELRMENRSDSEISETELPQTPIPKSTRDLPTEAKNSEFPKRLAPDLLKGISLGTKQLKKSKTSTEQKSDPYEQLKQKIDKHKTQAKDEDSESDTDWT